MKCQASFIQIKEEFGQEKRNLLLKQIAVIKRLISGGFVPDKGKTYIITNGKFNGEVFINFLKLLLSLIKGNIDLVIDNGPVHHCKEVKDFDMIKVIAYKLPLSPSVLLFWKYLGEREKRKGVIRNFDKNMLKALQICPFNF